MPKITIAVPVYNEVDNIFAFYDDLSDALSGLDDWDVVLVDDGSQDGSWEKLEELKERHPDRVIALRLRRNYGQTAALAAAFDASDGDLIVAMDADLQNDPADIPKMLEKVDEGYDVVSGWRHERQDVFLTRRLPSMIANRIISWSTGVRLHDYGCSLKVYRREILQDVHLYGEMHRFLPALAVLAGAKLCEVPVNHRARKHGESKYGLGRTTRVILDLITVKFLLSYSTKPMQIFGKWGLYSMMMGFLMSFIMIWRKFLPPYEDITGTPWMYLAIFFFLGGLQFIGLGLLGEINVRTYFETQDKPVYTIRGNG